MRNPSFILLAATVLAAVVPAQAARVHVDCRAVGAGDGTSWRDAFTTLGAALDQSPWDEPLEVWVAGSVEETAFDYGYRDLTLLGGFAGNELDASERRPGIAPTPWTGSFSLWVGEGRGVAVVIDGFRIASARGPAVGVIAAFGWLDLGLEHSQLSSLDDFAVDVMGLENALALDFVDCRFDYSVGGVRIVTYCGGADATIDRCEFAGRAGTAIAIEDSALWYQGWFCPTRLALTRSTIRGGDRGLAVTVQDGTDDGVPAIPIAAEALLAANEISGVADAVSVLVSSDRCPDALGHGHDLTARVTAVGNTIADNRGDAFACRAAVRTSCLDDTDSALCAVEAWDNLVTGNRGHAFAESSHDPARSVVVSTTAVGNDLFGNGALFLRHGSDELATIAAVNALPGCRENLNVDPLYRGTRGRDYHLSPLSPAVDRGHPDAPFLSATDRDGRSRAIDGDGDGIPLPDLGACELAPPSVSVPATVR